MISEPTRLPLCAPPCTSGTLPAWKPLNRAGYTSIVAMPQQQGYGFCGQARCACAWCMLHCHLMVVGSTGLQIVISAGCRCRVPPWTPTASPARSSFEHSQMVQGLHCSLATCLPAPAALRQAPPPPSPDGTYGCCRSTWSSGRQGESRWLRLGVGAQHRPSCRASCLVWCVNNAQVCDCWFAPSCTSQQGHCFS